MENLISLLKTKTLRQSSITFSGSLINGALGAFFFILVARNLGPAGFGIFSLAVAVSTFIADISDLGTGTGIVRFVGKYRTKDPQKALRFLKLGLEIKLLAGFIIVILGYGSSPVLSEIVFGKPELVNSLRIAFLGVGAALLFSFVTNSLQAYQKFWHWSGIYVLTNTTRLLTIIVLIASGALTTTNTLLVYISIPLLGFVVGSFFIPTRKYLAIENEKGELKELFHYNKWVALSAFISAASSRMDTFISARLLSEAELGIYSASNQLVQVVPQLIGALGTVIAPKMAEINEKSFKKYFIKTQIMVVLLAILGLIGIPVAYVLIPLLYGNAFAGSIPIFVILLLAMLVFLIALPVHLSVYYYYGKPKLFFWLGLGHLIINIFLGWLMISNFGGIGAAVTVLVGMVFSFVVPAVWVYKKLKA